MDKWINILEKRQNNDFGFEENSINNESNYKKTNESFSKQNIQTSSTLNIINDKNPNQNSNDIVPILENLTSVNNVQLISESNTLNTTSQDKLKNLNSFHTQTKIKNNLLIVEDCNISKNNTSFNNLNES